MTALAAPRRSAVTEHGLYVATQAGEVNGWTAGAAAVAAAAGEEGGGMDGGGSALRASGRRSPASASAGSPRASAVSRMLSEACTQSIVLKINSTVHTVLHIKYSTVQTVLHR